MTTLPILAPHLLAGFGTAALVAGVGLFASSRPAHTTGGPIPVTVSNSPLSVTSADTTAQPFTANIHITIANGASGGSDNGNVDPGTQTVLIPAGKRLIVQTCSFYRSGSITGATDQIFINAVTNGTYHAFALPVSPGSTAIYIGTTQAMTFSVDGGTELLANAFRSGTSGDEFDTVVISGYLVNSP